MISIGNLQINKLFLGNLEVAKAYLGDVEVYGSTKKYMTMTVLDGASGTTIAPTVTGTLSPNLQYRINHGSWNDFIVGTTADIHAVAGDVVQFKGVNESGISTSDKNYMKFAISGNPVALSGNVMSLIDGVGDALEIPCNYCFYKMFSQSNVKTVSLDFLPATTLTTWCYSDLFSESLLENAPALPALSLKDQCYRGMFYGCQHFTQAPELQSTTLAPFCYQGMFQNCSALTTAPALPAMTLKERCYYYMFYGCSSLTQAPALPATELAPYCYNNMFCLCTSITTAPALPATTLADYCYAYMFYDCSALVNAPELPATTLVSNCYRSMFYRCTSLTQAPELPATTLASGCYQFMFFGGSNLNYVKSLATDITATNALNQWLYGVASTGTFVKKYGVSYPTGISGIPSGWTVVEERPKPEGKYMTMTVLDGDAGTTIAPTVTGSLPNLNLQYRINSNGDWTNFIVGTTADIQVVSGDWVQFKGVNESGISDSTQNYLNFAISGNSVALSGNVMSLIDGIGNTKVIPCIGCFLNLFKDTNIKTVTKDFLPATTLAEGCYDFMFWRCTSLTQAPELPATTLYNYCYDSMFYGCTALTTAPVLHATTLKQACYKSMFQGCTSLTTAPELPATTLESSCYQSMFQGCTSLTTAPKLPVTTISERCYESMFQGCTSLTTAPELPSTTLANLCYSNMFSGCTALTTAPALNATTLANSCYMFMFNGCTALTTAPALNATTLESSCYKSMFEGCTSLTTAPKLPATKLVTNCYTGMFRMCQNLNYVECYAKNISALSALKNWLSGVASSGTFVKRSGVSYKTGADGIPSGWTVEEI